MNEISSNDLAEIIRAEPAGNPIGSITGVSTDSRTVIPGDCFFAVIGDNFDGHDYVGQAIAKGAVCAVVSRDVKGAPILRVADTVKALGDFARHYRQQAGYKVIAITGSVGKTTTRQIAFHVLCQHFRVSQAQKNFNNQIGLPLTLLDADEDTQIVVAELGTNYPGEIAYLTRIALPEVAVITSVHSAHLDGLGDLQTIIEEKLSISEGLQPDGVFIINGDCNQLVSACRVKGDKPAAFYTFGKSDGCDYQAHNINNTGFGSNFTIDGTQVYLPLPGRGNVENALAAWAVCSRFGLTIDDFAQAVKTQPAVSMRTELLQIGTLTVLNDCYNANPASMKNALDILSNIDSDRKQRSVFICGDMAELGSQTEHLHAELGASVAGAGVQLVMAVGKFAKIAAEAAARSAEYDLQIKCFDDTLSACNNLKDSIKDYDIILVKGSRIAKLEMVVEKLKQLFSSSANHDRGSQAQDQSAMVG
jgi:UDP-N-acetylmuramoyl-tripeptide--D-alanyl-D-alanine ligase